jgi:mevalonate pyrophosphate decarboxylase
LVCLELKSDSFSYRTQLHSIPKLQHYRNVPMTTTSSKSARNFASLCRSLTWVRTNADPSSPESVARSGSPTGASARTRDP